MALESFYMWLETHPMTREFQLLILEKECGIVSTKNGFDEVTFSNSNASAHGLARELDGYTVRYGGDWSIVKTPGAANNEVLPKLPKIDKTDVPVGFDSIPFAASGIVTRTGVSG